MGRNKQWARKSPMGNCDVSIAIPSTGWFSLLISGTILSIAIFADIISHVRRKYPAKKVILMWLALAIAIFIVSFSRLPFVLSGLGMMAVAGLFVIYWRNRTTVPSRFFVLGAAVWGLTVALKLGFAILFNQPVSNALHAFLPSFLADPLYWLYIGLLTGIFECGGVIVLVSRTKMKEMNWVETIAFGIGFGAMEAILLGFISYASRFSASAPELSPLMIPIPILERISAMFIHIFSNVLIIFAVQSKRSIYFWESFFYKTAVDGIAAFALLSYGIESLEHIYAFELVIAFFGIAGVLGLIQLERRFGGLQSGVLPNRSCLGPNANLAS